MKCFTFVAISILLLAFSFAFQSAARAQTLIEPLGLEGQRITSLSVYYDIIAAGSDTNGVYWQMLGHLPDSSWTHIGLTGKNVRTVYAHKSGPLGWAIGAGIRPRWGDTEFVYCSYCGQEFQPISSGIVDTLTFAVVDLDGFPDPSICGETYAAGGRALYLRHFGCATWTPVYTLAFGGDIQTLRAHERFPGVVLAGGQREPGQGLLIKSLDFGETWQEYTAPGHVIDVDFTGTSADTVIAMIPQLAGVFRSLDGGCTWEQVFDTQPPDEELLSAVAISHESRRIYVAGFPLLGESPLYYSDDWGETWHQIHTNLSGGIRAVELGYDGTVYFASYTEGVFRLNAELIGVEESDELVPGRIAVLFQNRPNPFNPATIIKYHLAEQNFVNLTVYSADGRSIKTLVDKPHTAGTHDVTWGGRDELGRLVPSGVYFYRLTAGEYVETRRMVLVR